MTREISTASGFFAKNAWFPALLKNTRFASYLLQIVIVELQEAFAFCFFARQLSLTANGLCFFPRFTGGRLFKMLLELHFTQHPFSLKFFLQDAQRLVNVVVTNTDQHVGLTILIVSKRENMRS